MWRVNYKDGSVVDQFTNGQEISSESISRQNMLAVYLFNDVDKSIIVSFDLENNQNFFYRRRTRISSNNTTKVCHILGRTTKGNIEIIIFYVEGEGIYSRKDFDNNHPWFYPIEFKDCEL